MTAPSRRPARWARMSFDYAIGRTPVVASSPTPASVQWASPVIPSPQHAATVHIHSFHRLPRIRTVLLTLVVVGLVVFGKPGVSLEQRRAGRASATVPEEETYRYATPSPELDPYEPHPIHGLVADARRKWDAKVARQSTTLNEASDEYRRRYSREPPPGFDKWYFFGV